jgi:DNA-binding NarL/FixJ family response regulator
MDGIAFVREFKRISPEAGIVIMSGRLEKGEANEFRKMGVGRLLDKPFTQETMVEALKAVLKKFPALA